MKHWLFALWIATTQVVTAQEDAFTLDAETIQAAQQWVEENIDEDALRSLAGGDQTQVRAFLEDAQKKLQGEYVIDVAQFA